MANSKKYHIKNKNQPADNNKSTNKPTPLMGKGKIIIFLILGTAIVAGIYMAAIKAEFLPIMHIYWIVTAILLMVFLFLKAKNDSLYIKLTSAGEPTDTDKEMFKRKTKQIKYLLLVLMPFLFTLIGDVIYLFMLKDLDFFNSISNLF